MVGEITQVVHSCRFFAAAYAFSAPPKMAHTCTAVLAAVVFTSSMQKMSAPDSTTSRAIAFTTSLLLYFCPDFVGP